MTLAGAGMCLAGLPEAKAVTTTATQTETQNISLPQGLFANTALMNWAFPFLLTQRVQQGSSQKEGIVRRMGVLKKT